MAAKKQSLDFKGFSDQVKKQKEKDLDVGKGSNTHVFPKNDFGEDWRAKKQDKNPQEAVRNAQNETRKVTGLTQRVKWNDKEILEKASAGLALQGIYLGKSQEEAFKERETVIECPKVHRKGPLIPHSEKTSTHSSKEDRDSFEKTLISLGYNVATDCEIKYNAILTSGHVEGGLRFKQNTDEQSEDEKHSVRKFYEESRILFMPTTVFKFNRFEMRLSPYALAVLERIDTFITSQQNASKLEEQIYKKKDVQDKCKKFFAEFGTHVNTGSLHYGGIHVLKATYESREGMDLRTIKSRVSKAWGSYGSATVKGIGLGGGGYGAAGSNKSHTNTEGLRNANATEDVMISVTAYGGPNETTDKELWKEGLVTYNSTWRLIHRGKFMGIWEIVGNHDHLKNRDSIISAMKLAYEDIIKEPKADTRPKKSEVKEAKQEVIKQDVLLDVVETKPFKRQKEISLKDKKFPGTSVQVVDDNIWCCLENGINIYNRNLAPNDTIEFTRDCRVYSVVEVSSHVVVAATQTGLYKMGNKGESRKSFADGHHWDVCTHSESLYATHTSAIHAYNTKSWKKVLEINYPCCKAVHRIRHTIRYNGQHIVLACPYYDKLYTLLPNGKKPAVISTADKSLDIDGPRMCMMDTIGRVLVNDWRFVQLKHGGKWTVLELQPEPSGMIDGAAYAGHVLFVLSHNASAFNRTPCLSKYTQKS